MPIKARTTTADYAACTLTKRNAKIFTAQIGNQSALVQFNVTDPTMGGEVWQPPGGQLYAPGFWTFNSDDFSEWGVEVAQGIRFAAVNPATPAIVSVA